MPLPDDIIAERKRVAARYLSGSGIEIGALDAPTPLPQDATARYVDYRTVAELSHQYPELDAKTFVPVSWSTMANSSRNSATRRSTF